MIITITTITTVIIALLFFSCDNINKEPVDKFEGLWEIKGRTMFDGIQIKIEKETKPQDREFKNNHPDSTGKQVPRQFFL